MSYRIFMTIRRGMTDATAVCVFPWEKALLEEVHSGASANEVSIEEMTSLRGATTVKKVKLKVDREKVADAALSLEDQLRAMTRVSAEDDPKADLDAEYNRLAEKYGMHPEVPMPVVKQVYGSPTLFKQAVAPFLGSKPPKNLEDPTHTRQSKPADEDEGRPIAEMSKIELQSFLKKHKVEFDPKAKTEELRDLAETAAA